MRKVAGLETDMFDTPAFVPDGLGLNLRLACGARLLDDAAAFVDDADPDRFPRIRDVGAGAGLTPGRWQSCKTDIAGRITKACDPRVRVMLFEVAASILGRARIMSPLKVWGLRIAKRTSMKKAIVAVSRKLATILLAMWKSGTAYWAMGRPPASLQDFTAA
jgi:hypothetical protein